MTSLKSSPLVLCEEVCFVDEQHDRLSGIHLSDVSLQVLATKQKGVSGIYNLNNDIAEDKWVETEMPV